MITISQYYNNTYPSNIYNFQNLKTSGTSDNIGFCYSILTTAFGSEYKKYGFGLEYWDSNSGSKYPWFKIIDNIIYFYHDMTDFTTSRNTVNANGYTYFYWAIG